MKQLLNRDYTDPAFEITVAAHDDKSDVKFYLDVGSFPAGNDLVKNEELGGPSTVLTTVSIFYIFTLYHIQTLSAAYAADDF